MQSCDLTTGNSAAPTPTCQLSPASSGIIPSIGGAGFGIAHSSSNRKVIPKEEEGCQNQNKLTTGKSMMLYWGRENEMLF